MKKSAARAPAAAAEPGDLSSVCCPRDGPGRLDRGFRISWAEI